MTGSSSNLFQIHEADLAELERTLPQIADALTPILTNRLRMQIRRCQQILSQVRWNYGPPTDVTKIDVDPGTANNDDPGID